MSDSLTDLLVRSRQLAPIQVAQAQQTANAVGNSVVGVLLERGVLHEEVLLQLLQTHLPLLVYDAVEAPSSEALRLISQQEAERMLVLPLERYPGQLVVAMVDPMNQRTFEELLFLTGREIRPLLGRYSDVVKGIHDGYRAIATRVMGTEISEAANAVFPENIDTEEFDARSEHLRVQSLHQQLEALVQLLTHKGIITSEELTAALSDIDLENGEH